MKNFMQGLIGLAVMAGFFFVCGALMYGAFKSIDITGSVKDVLLILFGGLVSMATTVVAFYFGSSKGSAAKDETIKNISEGQQ